MKNRYLIASGIAAFFVFGCATAQSYFSKTSYEEVNVYHHYDQPVDDSGLNDEKAKMMRDQRLENMVSDPNDYKLESDRDTTPQKHKHSKKRKQTVRSEDNDE